MSALRLVAVVSGLGLLLASVLAAVAAAEGHARRRRLARIIALVAAAPLALLLARPSAQPLVTLALAAAIGGPQPLALAVAAAAAVLAGLLPAGGAGSIALALAGVATALAAHALGRSAWAHLAAGRDAAWTSSAAGAGACGLVLAVGGGGVLRWDYGFPSTAGRVGAPDAGLVLGLTLLASLAGALLLGADALAATDTPVASPLARMLGRRALLVASGLALVAAFLVLRATGGLDGMPAAGARHVAGLVAAVGLIACTVPALLAERAAGDALEEEQEATVLGRLAAVVALLAVLFAGVEGWMRAGTYVTPLSQRLLAGALVGFAATETTVLRPPARALTLAVLALALLAPAGELL